MQGRPGETRRGTAPRTASSPRLEEQGRAHGEPVNGAKSAGMPNLVKGLQLSLYPIIKEH
jgi:gamma-glutamyltranspeptidase